MNTASTPASKAPQMATPEQDQTLREDVAQVLALRSRIKQYTHNTFDTARVCAVTPASPGGEHYLPYTIPTLIKQIARAGKRADIVIGLNNGYECPLTIAGLSTLLDTEIIHLYTGDKPGAHIPAPIFASPDHQDATYHIPQASNGHRIFVLHQKRGPHAPGKIRVLGDICHSLLLHNIAQGWIPPLYLLMLDQETLVLEDHEDFDTPALVVKMKLLVEQGLPIEAAVQRVISDHYAANRRAAPTASSTSEAVVDLNGRGVDRLIERMEQTGADISSVRWKNCAYNIESIYRSAKVILPSLNVVTSILHRMVYEMTGLSPYTMTFSGGCTLGRMDALLATHSYMASAYPGLTAEDAMATVLAYNAGFSTFMERQLYNTNRCFARHETLSTSGVATWKDQYARWIAGNDAIERLYGFSNITPMQGDGEAMSPVIALVMFAKKLHQTNDLAKAWAVLEELQAAQADFAEINQIARQKNYIYKGDFTQAAW